MHLYQIDILVVVARARIAVVVDELAANFEKHFDAVNEEKNEHDEQQECVAAAEK